MTPSHQEELSDMLKGVSAFLFARGAPDALFNAVEAAIRALSRPTAFDDEIGRCISDFEEAAKQYGWTQDQGSSADAARDEMALAEAKRKMQEAIAALRSHPRPSEEE